MNMLDFGIFNRDEEDGARRERKGGSSSQALPKREDRSFLLKSQVLIFPERMGEEEKKIKLNFKKGKSGC